MMKKNGFEPEIIPADVDEKILISMSCESAAMAMALKKAARVADKSNASDCLIIGADTIVVLDGEIIGKPASKEEAFNVLSKLRNNAHHVITGVCIIDTATGIKYCFYEDTAVFFKDYSDEELLTYINTPEPYDKAGGYAIQGTFSKYIDRFEGDFDNVVGFPWNRISEVLISQRFG